MPTTLISLNIHPTVILSPNTPVKEISTGGRVLYVFIGDDIEDYIVLKLESTTLPVPRVGNTMPTQEVITTLVNGKEVEISVNVSSGTEVSDLPDPQEGTIFISSYPTASAAKRDDIWNPGPLVYKTFNEEKGQGDQILGALGLNRFN